MTTDALGDRMKMYESSETGRRFMPMLPVYARIDGRNFSRFTEGMDRPYDQKLADCMTETTRRLMKETAALAGYTQSDEISLLFHAPDPKSDLFFDGKIFKMVSVTAALTTSIFTALARAHWPDRIDRSPLSFDCRAFQLPTKDEAANAFLWRELDATKNAVSMAARCHFSHRELLGKSGPEMQEMMFQKAAVNFNDFPTRFKRGVFLVKRMGLKEIDPEALARIPEQYRPDGPVERPVIAELDMPRFGTVTNRVEVLFEGADPITESQTGTGEQDKSRG